MDRKRREEGFKDAGVGTEDARGCEDGEDAFQEAREYIPRGGRMIRSSERQEMASEVGKIQRGRTSDMRRQQGICKGADVIIYVFFCYENTLWTVKIIFPAKDSAGTPLHIYSLSSWSPFR
jgi:hypothetical protein